MAVFSGAKKPAGNPALTLRDVAPEFARVSDKLTELCRREDKIHAELTEIRDRIGAQAMRNQSSVPPHYFGLGRPKKSDDKVIAPSGGAAALLGDLAPESKVIAGYEQPVEPDAARIYELSTELEAVREAISLIRDVRPGERYSVWDKAHLDGSKTYCDKIAPEYATVARAYLDALIALGVAHEAHEKFMKDRLCGVAHASLRPIVPLLEIGDLHEKTSPARAALERAIDLGRLEPEAIPPHWNR
jgi:hypothetical protein